MFQLDTSFELLSSMSPKLNKLAKKSKIKHSPCKLSLKKNLRKSSIFDKQLQFDLDESVILIEDSFEDKRNIITKVKINKTVDIVSVSSESISDSCESEHENISERNSDKFIKIDKWLSDNEKIDELSDIHSFQHKTYDDSDNDSLNSRFSSGKLNCNDNSTKNTDKKLTDTKKSIIKASNDNIFTPNMKKVDLNNSTESIINNSFEENIENYENILDSLYGTSWRDKKDDILPKSERKPQKKLLKISPPKTERKPLRSKLFDNKKRLPSILNRLKNICDSDTESDESFDSFKSLSKQQLVFSDSEDEMPPLKVSPKNNGIKKIKKNLESSDSSGINFSDSDLDLDSSLRTRVQKKLLKKNVKTLKDFSSTPKKTLVIKETPKKNIVINETPKKTLVIKEKLTKKVEKKPVSSDKVENKIITSKKVEISKTNVIEQEGYQNNNKLSFLASLSECLPTWQSDSEARYYRDNYTKEKENLAKHLFAIYNDKVFKNALPKETLLEWNPRINKTAGLCYNRRLTRRDGRVERLCRIVLAPKVLTHASRLRDTLLHEMCHAATWIINGITDGHGPQWRSWANKAQATFPELPAVKVCHNYVIHTKYSYKCQGCGYTIGRHSKSLDIERKRCGLCLGKFEVFVSRKSKAGDLRIEPAVHKTPRTTPFADFVKEHYKNVRPEQSNHAETMKVLGQKFKLLKVSK